MTGDLVKHLAGYLIRRACRRLPAGIRDERCREWTAELPAILDDPGVRSRTRRSLRALSFAADHARGTRRSSITSRLGSSGLWQARVIGAFTMVPLALGLVVVHIWWFRFLVAAGAVANIVLTMFSPGGNGRPAEAAVVGYYLRVAHPLPARTTAECQPPVVELKL